MATSAWPPVPTSSDGYSLFGGSGLFGGAPPPSSEAVDDSSPEAETVASTVAAKPEGTTAATGAPPSGDDGSGDCKTAADPVSSADDVLETGSPAAASGASDLPTDPLAAPAACTVAAARIESDTGETTGPVTAAPAPVDTATKPTAARRNPWVGPNAAKQVTKGRSSSPVFSDRSLASSSEEEPEQAALRQQAKLAAAARANAEHAARESAGAGEEGGGPAPLLTPQGPDGAVAGDGGVVLTVAEFQAMQQQVSTLQNKNRQLEMLLEEKVDTPGLSDDANQRSGTQAQNSSPDGDPVEIPDTFHTGPVNKAGQQQSWRNRQNEQQQAENRAGARGRMRGGGEGPVVQLRSGPDDDFRLDRPRGARMTEKWQKRWTTGSWGDRPYMIKARQGSYSDGRAFAESVVLNAAGVDRMRIHQTYTNLFVGCAAAITAAQLAVLKVHPDVEYVRTAARDVM